MGYHLVEILDVLLQVDNNRLKLVDGLAHIRRKVFDVRQITGYFTADGELFLSGSGNGGIELVYFRRRALNSAEGFIGNAHV